MTDQIKVFLKANPKIVTMVAPSFVVDFNYPEIIGILKAAGFGTIVELTFGAKMVNISYYEFLKKVGESTSKKTWISSPCPTLIQTVRNRFPHLLTNLVPVHSPMGAMSLICRKYFPEHKQVFIGPCVTKKLEAKEIGGIDLVLTFKELKQFLVDAPAAKTGSGLSFEKFYNDYTKIYPISGGLSTTLNSYGLLKERDILVADGTPEIIKILTDFSSDGVYKNYKFLDLLSCKGGCIGGPGIACTDDLSTRTEKVKQYRVWAAENEKDLGRTGVKAQADDINFDRIFSGK